MIKSSLCYRYFLGQNPTSSFRTTTKQKLKLMNVNMI